MSLFLLYMPRNTLPVSNMLIYWSEVVPFSVTPDSTVEATVDILPLAIFVNSRVMPSVMPPAVSAAPKAMEHNISHTVVIIPDMPRVATSSANIPLSEANCVGPYTICIMAANLSPLAISAMFSG